MVKILGPPLGGRQCGSAGAQAVRPQKIIF